MKRAIYSILGFVLLFIGFSYLLNSITGIIGFIILEDTNIVTSGMISILCITAGFTSLSLARRKRKAQAAMEFLMTYGWAILVATIAIGVLAYFGIFKPLIPGTMSLSPPFYADTWSVNPTSIDLELKNGGGEYYTIKRIDISNCGTFSTSATINPGEQTAITVPCTTTLPEGNQFKGDITITYRKPNSNLDHTSTGIITDEVISLSPQPDRKSVV